MNQNLFIRLAFAAHRVADALPREELKQEIKESANVILGNLILFVEKEGVLAEKRKQLVPQILRQIDVLAVYLEKAKHEGWVHASNFSVLEREYARIKEFLLLFDGIEESVGHTQAFQNGKDDGEKEKKEKVDSRENLQETKKQEDSSLTVRQKKIIEFLKRKEHVQVWELQKILPQVTKRTLRRDLDSLLQLNLVERKGEWNAVAYGLKGKEAVV